MLSGIRVYRSETFDRWAPPLALATGFAVLIAFGMAGGTRHGLWALDLEGVQAAGRTWLEGEGAYDRAGLDRDYPRAVVHIPPFVSPAAPAPLFTGLGRIDDG